MLEARIMDISRLIINNYEKFSFSGLLEGNTGVMLYLAYVSENVEESISKVFKDLIHVISITDQIPNFGVGFGGFSWVILHLVKENKISKEYISVIEEVMPLIENDIKKDLIVNNYDLFYGYIGKALILFELKKLIKVNDYLLKEIFESIKSNAIKNDAGIYWNDFENRHLANLGLAHGIPSIIMFLVKYFDHCHEKRSIHNLVLEACKWILSIKHSDGISQFGTTYGDGIDSKDSRLAWCYGDLGIALTLILAGQKINNAELIKSGVGIGEYSCNRLVDMSFVDTNDSGDLDITFCHGTSGISYMYLRLFELTMYPKFKTSASYWLNITLDSLERRLDFHSKNGFNPKEINGQMVMAEELGVLNGLAGVGLVLKSFLNDRSYPWDLMFLLRE